MTDELREDPRVSMHKLAEYAVTEGPRRRRAIILGQIRPPRYITTTYEDARHKLVRFFSDQSGADPERLIEMAEELRDRSFGAREDKDRAKSLLASARALESFADFAERVRVKDAVAVAGPRRDADLFLAGVRVVVCPDVCFLQRGTERRIGALKFHFPVAYRLNTEALQYAAAILFAYLEERGDSPVRSACLTVDVMAGQFQQAPRAMKARLANLEAACEEIAERWPVLLQVAREAQSKRK